jgi:ergothioneine biosynthesis protein EgtB
VSQSGGEEQLRARFLRVRATTEALCGPLSAEDAAAQSMPDASPAKWHLAHTSWFFETFILAASGNYRVFSAEYSYLFNSYYDSVGARVARAARGLITRPGLAEVNAYRHAITGRIAELLDSAEGGNPALRGLIELGVNHEEQHQELILMDIKHLFAQNPLRPAYHSLPLQSSATPTAAVPSAAVHHSVQRGSPAAPYSFRRFEGGLVSIGHRGAGFAFDNEGPEHFQYLAPYALGKRLVTNAEYLDFIRDGGYERPELWLSDGFRWRLSQGVSRPLYWEDASLDNPRAFTLAGALPLALDEPVCHVSYYEADAFARWSGARLPTEGEWEHAAFPENVRGNLLEAGRLHPSAANSEAESQLFGDVWEWTASAYAAYPGYQAVSGALGEYNGKFMCNQIVLRGGSCVTPGAHMRASYRNFFPPEARWQFAGIRLSRYS